MKRETLFKIYKNIFPLWLVDILFRPKKESTEGELYTKLNTDTALFVEI